MSMWNINRLSGKALVCDELSNMMVDVHCLLDLRFGRLGSSMFGMN